MVQGNIDIFIERKTLFFFFSHEIMHVTMHGRNPIFFNPTHPTMWTSDCRCSEH